MSINTLRPTELIDHRKIVSDKINNTENLTFAESKNDNTRAAAYHDSSNLRADLDIKYLEQLSPSDDLLDYDLGEC